MVGLCGAPASGVLHEGAALAPHASECGGCSKSRAGRLLWLYRMKALRWGQVGRPFHSPQGATRAHKTFMSSQKAALKPTTSMC